MAGAAARRRSAQAQAGPALRRLHLQVAGQVQGVGFRPFVYRLAQELALSGWVRNECGSVAIEVQGPAAAVAAFREALQHPPALARLESVEVREAQALPGEAGFRIRASAASGAPHSITPDTAVCGDCLAELLDPANRRYRYPFLNCTNCGPRYTLTARLPYDRAHTSMARFALCSACAAEYADPADRRFHAQPTACADCGPRAWLLAEGAEQPGDPLAAAWQRLARGEILALRGLGGFHLVCDAANPQAVARLRRRKQREAKPLAVMVPGLAAARTLARLSPEEAGLLAAPERPIVLLDKREGCEARLPGVAPGVAELGLMLPYTPLHYLLFHEAHGRPAGVDWLERVAGPALVCTSANPAGEPLVIGNDEALERLGGIADAFLLHDREILVRCDDSVQRWRGGAPAFVRRSRGYTPQALRLPAAGSAVLAVGAGLKSTVCVTRGDQAYLSQHLGDLDSRAARTGFDQALAHLCRVLAIEPRVVVRDLHPDFHSSRVAQAYGAERGLPVLAVQHHHAHIAAVAAEHGLGGPLLGLALDGVGLGSDGGIWGGELLRLEGAAMQRLGHLATLPLPGGDRAAREPWRMAAAVLHRLGRGGEIARRFEGPAAAAVAQMLERDLHCPPTSSAGRLFDAAAGLLGVRQIASYEGQAAMELEALAASVRRHEPLSGGYRLRAGRLDLLPLLASLVDEPDAARGAARFHATLVEALAEWVAQAAAGQGLVDVALGGGCLLNRILSDGLRRRLSAAGLRVHEARRVPPNDGGLSLGQAWIGLQAAQAAGA